MAVQCLVLRFVSTEYIEWQRPISGVHFIMKEKSALAGEGAWGMHAHPFSLYFYHLRTTL
jgi:hypothetical protein